MRILVIGSGIVGASIARIASMYRDLDVYLVEREADVGWGASKANTGIIHPGHEEDPRLYPFRAKLCVEGNRLWKSWARDLDIPIKFPGELMLVFEGFESEARRYIDLARINGIPGVRLLYHDEVERMEPLISDEAVAAVWAPTAGIISPIDAVIALVENAVSNGIKLLTETEVKRVIVSDGRVRGVETNIGFIGADIVVNAGGIHADEIARTVGLSYRLKPRKGEYILFDSFVEAKPKHIIHPVPTSITKGVYIVETVEGNLMIGPTAVDLLEDAKDDTSTSTEGLSKLLSEASRLLKELPPRDRIVKFFAGVRPEPPNGDWIIEAYTDPWGFVDVAGIRSPGLTAAPAIALHVFNLIRERYDLKLKVKDSWNPHRRGIARIKDKPKQLIKRLVEEDSRYGSIVCWCNMVSEAEILEAIGRMKSIGLKTITLDGVKFRSKAMYGFCQGSFCRARIAYIVSKIEGIPLWDVRVNSTESKLGVGDVKSLVKGGSYD
ncbi:MAG: NAD(P)/FAD-dependent oxidoreductase [Nitrososphaerota archaeon]|nr:NAD(P)/FAD-dependent oxidoreductase [Candidatus Bathyarchaeota archaeon]MDW8062255.1 NAD(P)/FAD-dependent oxidoreductase [Nitrososphaerota archaeon]